MIVDAIDIDPSPEKHLMSIGEVAEAHSVSFRALRFYEEKGMLKPIRIREARYYDKGLRCRLEIILHLKQMAFTLLEIQGLLARYDEDPASGKILTIPRSQIVDQLEMLKREADRIANATAKLREVSRAKSGALRVVHSDRRRDFE